MLLVTAVTAVPQLSGPGSRRNGLGSDTAGAAARIDETLFPQNLERREIDVVAIALTSLAASLTIRVGGIDIWTIAEPIQIVENADLKLSARSNAIAVAFIMSVRNGFTT